MSNSNTSVQPYLFFNGRCEEALEFYRSAVGAEVEMLSRFKDAPEPGMTQPGMEDKVMHASFRIGETTPDGFGWQVRRPTALRRFLAFNCRSGRGKSRERLQRACGRRQGYNAS